MAVTVSFNFLLTTVPQVFRVDFFGVFCVFCSRIFFNTAPRSPKVGKNVDKSLLIITVWSKFTESKPTLLFCAVYYN